MKKCLSVNGVEEKLLSKITSVDSSLKIFSIACIAASDQASCLAHTWSDPADKITSFLRADTMTFPVILRILSPTQSLKPGYLSRR